MFVSFFCDFRLYSDSGVKKLTAHFNCLTDEQIKVIDGVFLTKF